jgi:hypothetical protein
MNDDHTSQTRIVKEAPDSRERRSNKPKILTPTSHGPIRVAEVVLQIHENQGGVSGDQLAVHGSE